MEATGYVHDLFRLLACCDLAVVQGGLTTTMELVANRRPFISIPLRNHFEQNHHVVHRLRRYGAPEPTPYEEATPAHLAALMRARLGALRSWLLKVDCHPEGGMSVDRSFFVDFHDRPGGPARAHEVRLGSALLVIARARVSAVRRGLREGLRKHAVRSLAGRRGRS
jgi:hypothetical protein